MRESNSTSYTGHEIPKNLNKNKFHLPKKYFGFWTLVVGTCLGFVVSKLVLKDSKKINNKQYQEFEDYLGV
jgi:uncharacterized membrane protein YkvI